MLVDLKHELNHPTVRKLVSESAWDQSAQATDMKIADFRLNEDLHLYGWIEGNVILGVCGIAIHSTCIEIRNIAVEPNVRKRGIGNAMVTALQQKYNMTVEAETDDDAVGFYQKCGFETVEFTKAYPTGEFRRYKCVLLKPGDSALC